MENGIRDAKGLRRLEVTGFLCGVVVQIVAVVVKADLFFALFGAVLILIDLLPDRSPPTERVVKGATFSSGFARGVVATEIIGLVLVQLHAI